MQHPGETIRLVLTVGESSHTPEHPFCADLSCTCHEDPKRLAEVSAAVTQGLLTPDEAKRLVNGKMV